MVKAEVDSIASGQAGMFSKIQCKCSSPYTVDQAKESGKIRLRAYVANGIQGTKKDWSEISFCNTCEFDVLILFHSLNLHI